MSVLFEYVIHFAIYAALFFLAIVCVIAANAMDRDSPGVHKTVLIAIIMSCFTLAMCTHYDLAAEWLLLAILPLIVGAAAGLVENLHVQNIHIIVEIKKATRKQLVHMFIESFRREK